MKVYRYYSGEEGHVFDCVAANIVNAARTEVRQRIRASSLEEAAEHFNQFLEEYFPNQKQSWGVVIDDNIDDGPAEIKGKKFTCHGCGTGLGLREPQETRES